MKIKFNIRRLLIASIGFLLVVGGIYLYSNFFYDHVESGSSNLTYLKPVDEKISEDLPHQQYQKLKDSVDNRRKAKNGVTVGSMWFSSMGLAKINICDTCKNAYFEKGSREYRMLMPSWKLRKDNGFKRTYYVEKGQSYIRYFVCGPNKSKNPKYELKDCKELEKKVRFRYDIEKDEMGIPISERSYHMLNWLLIGYGIALFVFSFYFILLVFLKFLQDIAYGNPFSEENVKRLRTIALNLLILPVSTLLMTIIPRLVFNSYFTEDLEMDVEIWSNFAKPLLLSIIFAALYIAFKKGKKLQEEADLTV